MKKLESQPVAVVNPAMYFGFGFLYAVLCLDISISL